MEVIIEHILVILIKNDALYRAGKYIEAMSLPRYSNAKYNAYLILADLM